MLLVNHNTVLGPAATIGRVSRYSGTCLKRPPLGPKLLAALDRWSYYAGSTECKRVINFRTTGSGHNREVVALYWWPLVQVPLYYVFFQNRSLCTKLVLLHVCTTSRKYMCM